MPARPGETTHLVGRERARLAEDLVPALLGLVERVEHQVQVRGERAHARDLGLARAWPARSRDPASGTGRPGETAGDGGRVRTYELREVRVHLVRDVHPVAPVGVVEVPLDGPVGARA